MKVLLAFDWFVHYSAGLANALAEGHEVHVVYREESAELTGRRDPEALRAFLCRTLAPGIRLHPLRRHPLDPRGVGEAARLLRLAREIDPDVVHLQSSADWRLVLLALATPRSRVVTTLHDVTPHRGERIGRAKLLLRGLLLRASGGIILHGEALREGFSRLHPELARTRALAVIPHGVMESYGSGLLSDAPEEEPFTLLFFGRLHPYKGLDTLLQAVPLLTGEFPRLRVIVAGEGPAFRAELAAAAGDPRFELHLRHIPVDEVAGLFARAAVVVLPYREASQSGIVPLAGQFGKPVVATKVGSVPEAVEEGGTGLVVDPEDPSALAAAVGRLLRDEPLRKKMGARARERAAGRLGWKALAKRTEELYRAVRERDGAARAAGPLPAAKRAFDARFPRESLRRRLAGGSFWLLLGSGLAQALALGVAVASARLVGLPDYGRLAIVLASLEMLVSFTAAGYGLAITRQVAASREGDRGGAGRVVGNASLLTLATGGAVSLVLFLAAGQLARGVLAAPDLAPLLRLGALYVLFATFNAAQVGVLMGLEAFRSFAQVNAFRYLVLLPLAVAGGATAGVGGIVLAYAASAAAACAVGLFAVRRECAGRAIPVRHLPDPAVLRELLRFSFPTFLAGTSFVLASWWGTTWLAVRAGFAEAGLFSAALKWQAVILFIAGALGNLGVPLLTSLAEKRDARGYGKTFLATSAVISLSAAAVALPVLLAPSLAMSLFGKAFLGGGATLVVVGLASVLTAVNMGVGHALWSLGLLRAAVAFSLLRAAALFAFAWWWAPQGAFGLGLAHLATQALTAAVQWPLTLSLVRRATAAWTPPPAGDQPRPEPPG